MHCSELLCYNSLSLSLYRLSLCRNQETLPFSFRRNSQSADRSRSSSSVVSAVAAAAAAAATEIRRSPPQTLCSVLKPKNILSLSLPANSNQDRFVPFSLNSHAPFSLSLSLSLCARLMRSQTERETDPTLNTHNTHIDASLD